MQYIFLLFIYIEETISDVIFYSTLKDITTAGKRDFIKRAGIYIASLSIIGFFCEINIESFLLLKTLQILCSLFFISFLTQSDISTTITLYTLNFTLIYIIQDAIALLLSLLAIDVSDIRVGMAANLMTIIILILLKRYSSLKKQYEILISQKHVVRIIIVNLFLFFQIIDYYFKAQNELYNINLLFIISAILIVIVLNFVIVYEEQKIHKTTIELELTKRNSALMDNMIQEIRRVQHQYDDRINSIISLAKICEDFDTLQNSLLEYTESGAIRSANYNLLKLDMKLVAALLYTKANQAKDKGIDMTINLNSYTLCSQATEMDLVDILSILINNMFEACSKNDPCSLTLNNHNKRLIITTKNIGPELNIHLQKALFSDGYTTKNDSSRKHGHGLYNLKKIVDRYSGNFSVFNEHLDQKTYILFRVEV